MAELVRVAALTGYFPAMEALNADPSPLLREVGLSRKLLSQPEQLISARTVMRLLERSAEVTGCRTLGLRMAPNRGLADLGATSLLIEHEPTLREALSALNRYRNRINPILMLHIEDIGDGVLIRQNFSVSDEDISRQATELALSTLARLCFLIVGDDWQPEMVCFTCEAPPASDVAIYHRVFRCPADFNAECNGIVITSRDLDRASQRADSAMAEHARKLIEATMSPEQRSLSQQVEQSMLLLLPSGRATIQSCCALLGVTVRTLQRDLDAEGTSFSRLLHKARMQLANQYLSNPHTRISDVAGMLGYNSISAFSRWHQQTYGMSPKDRRKRH
jgi:AraC-like DNA-binding protein